MGKWAAEAAVRLAQLGWQRFVEGKRGDPHISPTVSAIPHKARRLLQHLRQRGAGVPVQTSPWTREQLAQATHRGSHTSAKDHVEFVCEEMLGFAHQGFWTVLPALDGGTDPPTLTLVAPGSGTPARPQATPHC
jgi:hypothetical protein